MGYDIVPNPHGRRLTERDVSKLLNKHTVGMIAGVEPLTAQVFQCAPSLRVVSRCGIGMDSVDLEAANSRGITVLNTPDAPTEAVAELTVGFMLALIRHIPQSDRELRQGNWQRFKGSLLSKRTVGLVGYGRIGKTVARMLWGFGATVLAYDVCANTGGGDFARRVDWETLLSESDIISLHIPGGANNKYLIGASELSRCKRGAYLINTARGELVDEAAVAKALESGQLAGVAIDAFIDEPYDGILTQFENTVLTPHIGSYAAETRAQMEYEAAFNLFTALQ